MDQAKALDIIKTKLTERINKNPLYSMRAMARDLNMSPSYLCKILNGQKSLTIKRSLEFAEHLKLNSKQKKILFQNSVMAQIPKELRTKIKNINGHDLDTQFESLEQDQIQVLKDWYHLAILELTLCQHFKQDFNWIARRLGIRKIQVEDAWNRLKRLNLLVQKKGRWIKCRNFLGITFQNSNQLAQNFHATMMEKSIETMKSKRNKNDFNLRSISGTTISINKNDIPEIKSMIKDFRKRLVKKFSKKPNAVYHLAVQLIPLERE